jgi:hypothetical protein
MEQEWKWKFILGYAAPVLLLLPAPGCAPDVTPAPGVSGASESLSMQVLLKPTSGLGHANTNTVGCPFDAEWECVSDGTSFAANDGNKYIYSTGPGARDGTAYSGAPVGAVTQVTTNVVAVAESGATGTVTVALYSADKLLATGEAHPLTTTYAQYSDAFSVSVASANTLETWVTLSTADLKFSEIWIAADLGSNADAGDAAGTQKSVTLSWAASTTPGVTYNLFRGTISGGPYSQIQSGITSTSATDTTVVAGNIYYYVAESQNSNGESVNSNQVQAVIP